MRLSPGTLRDPNVNVHAVPFPPFKFCQQKLSMSMELPESLYIFYDTGIKMETPRIITALAKTNYAWVEMGLNPPYLRGAHIHIYLMTPDVACKWHNLKKISGSAFWFLLWTAGLTTVIGSTTTISYTDKSAARWKLLPPYDQWLERKLWRWETMCILLNTSVTICNNV